MKTIIRNYIAKLTAGRADDGIMISLPDLKKVDFQAAMMEDLLMRRGIDPNAIQSEEQLKMIINQIKAMEKAEDAAQAGIKNTESAKVFNRMGEELDPNKPIIGGTQTGKSIDTDTFIRLAETNTQRMKQRIADKKVRTEEDIKADLEAENKKGIEGLKQKMAKEKSRTQRISGNLRADNSQRVEIGRPKLDEDEYEYYKEILGEDANVDYYPVKGDESKEFLESMVKEQKDEVSYMKRLYDKGALDDPEKKADGGRIGFFMGSTLPKGLATLRQMLQYMGKKSDVVKNPSDVLKMVNPKSLNAMLNDPKLQRKVNIKEGILASDMVKGFQSKMGEDRVQLVKDMLSAAKNIKKADTSQIRLKNEMIEDMMKKGVDRRTAEEMATTMSRLAEDMAGKFKDTPKLTDEGILELENVLKNMETGGKKKRDLNADGGRIGLKDGMNRRTFLKLLSGFAAIPIIGKFIKPLKTVKGVKNVPIIKTDNVPGKPEWFDQLVNKVIIEGDDVTKKLATKDREVVHVKKLNDTDEVTVYQDLETDSIRVEYNSPQNMLEEPVDLSYKKTLPDEGNPKGDVDFEATEMGYVGKADGPDDFFIDAEEVGGRSIKDLDSDVSALKEYATGKGPTMKEIVQKKKRKDKVKKLNEGDLDAQSDYITARQGDAYDYDDYASGGIARMLGE